MFDTVNVIEDAENFFDHHPITVCFGVPTAVVGDVPCIDVLGEIEDVQTIGKVVRLDKVKEEYGSVIDAALQNVYLPDVTCNNINCIYENCGHIDKINEVHKALVDNIKLYSSILEYKQPKRSSKNFCGMKS